MSEFGLNHNHLLTRSKYSSSNFGAFPGGLSVLLNGAASGGLVTHSCTGYNWQELFWSSGRETYV